jgi:carboxyvinyl-carboxyphosphonate phosphorylmutase
MADALERAHAYDASGADVLFFTGVTDRPQLEALTAGTSLPIMLGGLPDTLQDRAYLASQRVRIALQGHQPVAADTAAVYSTLKQLREGVAPSELTGLPDANFMKRLLREAEYTRHTREFLGDA